MNRGKSHHAMADRARISERVATALEPLSALTGVREGEWLSQQAYTLRGIHDLMTGRHDDPHYPSDG